MQINISLTSISSFHSIYTFSVTYLPGDGLVSWDEFSVLLHEPCRCEMVGVKGIPPPTHLRDQHSDR